ncbi:ribosome recycling factor [Succinispira mobilis]|uniref:ribosome recycling factor n=1 Tax=Succinispira mobilis TaxID=78120 RepID=UPI00036C6CA6|nr:ribosome recycling factor [Succinispira mobilis]
MSVAEIRTNHENKMKKALDVLKHDLASVRAGRANPSILEKVMVDYYGTPTAVNQLANVTVPEPRMIVIQPWEKNLLKDIEKAIMKSDLGLNPNNDGSVIRLNIPQLTEQRRQEIVKSVSKKVEDSKVAIRNIRRDANDCIKKLEKDKEIAQDESKKAQEDMQKLTDKYIKIADEIYQLKEKEIVEV